MFVVSWLLFDVCCLSLFVVCRLFVVRGCSLFGVCCLLRVVVLFVVCLLLCDVCCLFAVARCALFLVRCSLFNAGWLMSVVRYALLVVCCLLCLV